MFSSLFPGCIIQKASWSFSVPPLHLHHDFYKHYDYYLPEQGWRVLASLLTLLSLESEVNDPIFCCRCCPMTTVSSFHSASEQIQTCNDHRKALDTILDLKHSRLWVMCSIFPYLLLFTLLNPSPTLSFLLSLCLSCFLMNMIKQPEKSNSGE